MPNRLQKLCMSKKTKTKKETLLIFLLHALNSLFYTVPPKVFLLLINGNSILTVAQAKKFGVILAPLCQTPYSICEKVLQASADLSPLLHSPHHHSSSRATAVVPQISLSPYSLCVVAGEVLLKYKADHITLKPFDDSLLLLE